MIGTNARMSSIQAAVLCVKLGRLAEWNNLRRKHAAEYAAALRGTAVQPPEITAASEHVFHLFVVRTSRRSALREYLWQKGIETGIHYPVPLHLTEAYHSLGYPGRGALPVSEQLAEEILSLPMFPELSEEQKSYTAAALREFPG
jgi:dTDP-4-amino-4,6-dideoxygalactose transaminase